MAWVSCPGVRPAPHCPEVLRGTCVTLWGPRPTWTAACASPCLPLGSMLVSVHTGSPPPYPDTVASAMTCPPSQIQVGLGAGQCPLCPAPSVDRIRKRNRKLGSKQGQDTGRGGLRVVVHGPDNAPSHACREICGGGVGPGRSALPGSRRNLRGGLVRCGRHRGLPGGGGGRASRFCTGAAGGGPGPGQVSDPGPAPSTLICTPPGSLACLSPGRVPGPGLAQSFPLSCRYRELSVIFPQNLHLRRQQSRLRPAHGPVHRTPGHTNASHTQTPGRGKSIQERDALLVQGCSGLWGGLPFRVGGERAPPFSFHPCPPPADSRPFGHFGPDCSVSDPNCWAPSRTFCCMPRPAWRRQPESGRAWSRRCGGEGWGTWRQKGQAEGLRRR